MRTVILALLVVPVLAGTVLAGLSQDVVDVRSAVTDRVVALDGLLDPAKSEEKEAKRLDKVLRALADYLGVDDADDLGRVYKAAKYISKSRTVDPAVLAALEEIADALDTMAGEIRADAVMRLPSVREEKKRKVQKRIDKGDDKRSDAHAYGMADARRYVKYLVKAIRYYRQAVEKAKKYEAPLPPPSELVYVHMTQLHNKTDHEIEIIDITVTVSGRLGGQPYSYTASLSVESPTMLRIPVASQGSYELLPVMTMLANSDPARPSWVSGDIVTTSYVIETTEGDISS